MKENVIKIPANKDEIDLYCFMGEALLKTQVVEQAFSHSITLKMNQDKTKERTDEFLKQTQSYTLGKAIRIANEKKLYNLSLQDELNALQQRNWLIHKVIIGNEVDLNARKIKEELFHKIKSISDKAENIQRLLEYDLIDFSTSKRKDMSASIALLNIQDKRNRNSKVVY